MAKTLTDPKDLVANHDTGQYIVPQSVLIENELTTGDIGEMIMAAWRADRRKGHANSITISSYYWSEKDAFVISWRPGIVGRTG